ncbi:MAG: hypothetical protein ACYCVH_16425 [Ignavibacteriaceae bacterium]
MTIIEKAASEFNISPDTLLKISLESYLKQKSSKIDSEMFLISKKYGIKDISEMEEKILKGKISENIGYDDFFLFDNLQAEKEKIENLLNEIN